MAKTSATVRTGPRGLEITIPVAWAFTGTLAAMSMIGMLGVVIVVMLTTELTGVEPELLSILEFVFGRTWLWAGLVVALILMACDRFSNEHYILGTSRIERQFRSGPIVLNRERYPLAWVSDPGVEEDDGRWYVMWRWKGNARVRRRLNRISLTEVEATDIAEHIRCWLEAPGRPTAQAHGRDGGNALAESLIAMVSSRFGMAVPLLIGLTGLLLIAQVWLLHEETAAGNPRGIDALQVSTGQLQALQWVIDPASVYQGSHANVRMEAEILFELYGTTHALQLAGRKFESMLGFDSMYQRAVDWFGPNETRFIVPAKLFDRVPADSDWRSWSELRWAGPQGRQDIPPSTLDLLVSLDRPWLYQMTTPPARNGSLRLAFPPGRPDQAMPLAWYQAEQAARANISLPVLAPVTLMAMALVLIFVPAALVRSLDRRWIARLLIVLFILAVPWWAGHAENLPRWLGVDNLVNNLTADLLRLHSPHRDHLWFAPISAGKLSDGTLVEWELERSDAWDLIVELGLTELALNRHWPSEQEAAQAWKHKAAATLAEFDDEGLKSFAIAYGRASGPSRFGEIHRKVVEPAFCTLRPRLGSGYDYERFIDLQFRCEEPQ